jgi:hypothetical protein
LLVLGIKYIIMSTIKFACPGCGQHIVCDETGTGEQIQCPTCKEIVIVPKVLVGIPIAQSHPESKQVSTEDNALTSSDEVKRVENKPQLSWICELCGSKFHASYDQYGHTMLCPNCHQITNVSRTAQGKMDGVESVQASGKGVSRNISIIPRTMFSWIMCLVGICVIAGIAAIHRYQRIAEHGMELGRRVDLGEFNDIGDSKQVIRKKELPGLQEKEKIGLLYNILKDYHSKHTYERGNRDVFVCVDMANDVWNIVRTKGFNAKIQAGNLDKDIDSIADANHAWVLAEVSPGTWVALETTAGEIVYREDNPRYYFGHTFADSGAVKEYQALAREYNTVLVKYNAAVDEYNRLLERYKNANSYTQASMENRLMEKKGEAESRKKDLREILQKLNSLLLERS